MVRRTNPRHGSASGGTHETDSNTRERRTTPHQQTASSGDFILLHLYSCYTSSIPDQTQRESLLLLWSLSSASGNSDRHSPSQISRNSVGAAHGLNTAMDR